MRKASFFLQQNKMVKRKENTLIKMWVPKTTVKLKNPFAFYLGVLDKYSKKKPTKPATALSYVDRAVGKNVPTNQSDTRPFMRML